MSKLSEILRRLMFEEDIKAVELARRTNMAQPTVQRMVSGTTPNPHTDSLEPLADYFGISVAQLRGLEPIPWLHPKPEMPAGLFPIPIIAWDEASHWDELKKSAKDKEKVWIESNINPDACALRLQDSSMYPLFPEGTIVIIDPHKEIKDRCFVLVTLRNQSQAIFRQLLVDANQYYLKPLNPDLENFPMLKITKDDKICGVLAHARRDFIE